MNSSYSLFYLLRLAIGTDGDKVNMASLSSTDWRKLVDLSVNQGIATLAVDGLQKLLEANPNLELELDKEELEDLKYDWLGSTLSAEENYRKYVKAITSLARAYSDNGIEIMILKGYGLSLNYPIPSHRPTGDIDVFLSDWKKGDDVIRQKGIEIDYSHHHHSVFKWKGFTVENHYDIENRYASRKGRRMDDLLKGLALVARKEIDGIYFPSANFNGIFLISHAASHFAGDHITLRHLLDWALFVDKEWKEIDWSFVVDRLSKLGLLRFLFCMNALSIDCLGISAEKFPLLDRNSKLEARVLADILHPTFNEKGSGFIFKLRRLKANMWKRNLVSSESLVSRMVRLAWSHVRKPVV